MRNVVFASAIAGAAILVGPAVNAADIARPVYKAPPAPVATFSWTGFYVGGSVGARWLEADWKTTQVLDPSPGGAIPFTDDPNASFSDTAARFAGHIGYNWQVTPAWVVGLEADFGYADNEKTINRLPGTVGFGGPGVNVSSTVKATWDGSARLRAGYLVTPATLAYATGGLAWQRIEASGLCRADNQVCDDDAPPQTGTFSGTRLGWTIGGGLETMISPNWLVRAEYRYSDFRSFTFTALPQSDVAFGVTADVTAKTHIATVGISYKFGDYGKAPVMAKY